ncbi:MAG: hypothetical protein ABIJ86_16675, partial [Spirochaetota bacterium]
MRCNPAFVTVLMVTATVFLSFSCSTKAEMTIGKDHGASVSLLVTIPPEIETWLRRTSGMPTDSQLFNPDGTSAALRNRGFNVLSSRQPDQSSQAIDFEATDLAA